jgi:predicted phage terminase large subunit-like protein
MLASVCLPAFQWLRQPHSRFIYASYSQNISNRDSVKCRRLIQSPWYQGLWGDRFQLAGDQNAKSRFDNDRNGFRFASSVGGSVTGEGGDFIVVDDPLNAKDVSATSEAALTEVIEWWTDVMPTRVNDPHRHAKIIIMQRLHQRDMVGHLLDTEGGDWVHLCLPAEHERRVMIPNPLGFVDPRQQEGEELWQGRYPKAVLAGLEKNLGPHNYAAQFQQRPVPRGGGLFKSDWLMRYSKNSVYNGTIVQSWDTANTKKSSNAPSVCTTWCKTERGYFLQDVYRERLEFPELMRAILRQAVKFKPSAILVEDKASGQQILQQFRGMRDSEWQILLNEIGLSTRPLLPLIPVQPQGDKRSRAEAVTAQFASGQVFLPETADWLAVYETELLTFPASAFADQVDSTTQAISYMYQTGLGDSQFDFQPVSEDDYDG